MTQFDLYVLILCFIVFILLGGLSLFIILYITKLSVKLIRHGVEDEKIIAQYEKNKLKKKTGIIDYIVSGVFFLAVFAFFSFSIFVNVQEDKYFENIPTFKVVNTGSMSYKNEKNTYLTLNNLNDQFSTFDVILTYKLPDEEDLKLYDIVVYELNGVMVVHRIIGIEEPNDKHPDQRYFLLQGDANDSPDRYPVLYSQMKGIYKGQNIPFIGSLITFMQSPAGWICIFLIIGTMIGTPILESYFEKEKNKRLLALGYFNKPEQINETIEIINNEELTPNENIVLEEDLVAINRFDFKTRSFSEKIITANDKLIFAYNEINQFLNQVENINISRSSRFETYRLRNKPICRLQIKGKTLNVYISLNPKLFEDSKYIFEDVSNTNAFENYQMRLKITSNRQIKWAKELLIIRLKEFGIELSLPKIVLKNDNPFNFKTRTFDQKLRKSNSTLKDYYKNLNLKLLNVNGVRLIKSKRFMTYKYKGKPICKVQIKGKTLNVYLSLDPNKYLDSKYIFVDASNIKTFENYPMRMKITSPRQFRWMMELLDVIISNNSNKGEVYER
ncbi:MAG: hypothetical protein E7180_06195 [Erysipelotrichaceae bacterium]|nr:hypothetical protein [Erysipelotrichaceae bacterium]